MKNIAVLMGGYSSEWEISIKSGMVVAANLDTDFFNIYNIHIMPHAWYYEDANGNRAIIDKNDFSITVVGEKVNFDCCYNTIHGTPGEDGKLQAYLELLGIPQTSCNSYVAGITFNKRDTISIVRSRNIETAKNMFLNEGDAYDPHEIALQIGLPCFVKANRSGSSFGVSKVYEATEIASALETAFKEDNEVLIESFLEGTEVSVGVYRIGDEIIVLPATELVSENDFFDYEAKYLGQSQEITPARITSRQYKLLKETTARIYKYLNCSGIARADFIFHQGRPHFVEINTNPGMSEASIVPQQIRHMGNTLKEVFTQIILDCIKKHSA
jgi:D-alanine-D-alanine ligase